MDVTEVNLTGGGLGTMLSYLSMFAHTKGTIKAYTDPRSLFFLEALKRVFNISSLHLISKVELEDQKLSDFSDLGKLFSPYIDVELLTLFGSQHRIRSRSPNRKPCIGLSCYTDTQFVYNKNSPEYLDNTFPRNRQLPIEEYSEIFRLAREAGYDVISLDSRSVSIEQKIYIMNELCDCVIGYEGGICHLSHVLKIPTIMLPWHHTPSGGFNDNPEWHRWICELMQLDDKTYFLNSAEEILNWTPDDLTNTINLLKDHKGNNRILNGDNIEVTEGLNKILMNINGTPIGQATGLTKKEKEIINSYPKLLLGGMKEFTIVPHR